MRHVRAFAGFWYDFLVGDRWELFLGPIGALFLAWLAVRAHMPAAATGPMLFVLIGAIGTISVLSAVRR